MKRKTFTAVAAASAAAIITACGGGGGGAAPSLTLSGTAATGAALANASVTVKCATGNGTATTGETGAYSLNIAGAALPCIIQVAGTAGGVDLVLHSVADEGANGAGGTTAVANVTPLTEMVVAQMTGGLPVDLFESFTASTITPEKVEAAMSTILTALKDATGIDLTAIDPFKAELIAATSSTPTGNEYDQLLDSLAEKVPPASLSQLVGQIAVAANTSSGTPPVSLQEAMVAANAGTLENCPYALSGKYRTVRLYGATRLWTINFSDKTVTPESGSAVSLTPNSSRPCTFAFNDGSDQYEVAIGKSGAGIFKRTASNGSTPGYIFPVQSTSLSSLGGSWAYLQSGYLTSEAKFAHLAGSLSVDANGSAAICDYRSLPSSTACTPDDVARTLSARADGGVDLKEGTETVVTFYGYRAQNGAMAVFGTTDPTANAPDRDWTTIVAAKLAPSSLPPTGAYTNYEFNYARANGAHTIDSVTQESYNVTAVDAATDSYSRQRVRDGRTDTIRVNYPLSGMRYRAPSSWTDSNNVTRPVSEYIGAELGGLGIATAVNPPNGPQFFYSVSVRRP